MKAIFWRPRRFPTLDIDPTEERSSCRRKPLNNPNVRFRSKNRVNPSVAISCRIKWAIPKSPSCPYPRFRPNSNRAEKSISIPLNFRLSSKPEPNRSKSNPSLGGKSGSRSTANPDSILPRMLPARPNCLGRTSWIPNGEFRSFRWWKCWRSDKSLRRGSFSSNRRSRRFGRKIRKVPFGFGPETSRGIRRIDSVSGIKPKSPLSSFYPSHPGRK